MRIATVKGSHFTTVQGIVKQIGGELVLVDDPTTATTVSFDRLLLLGGADISPFWYGQPYDGTRKTNQGRDFCEWALVRRALSNNIPTLGICRGMQMLNAAAGGDLCQDLKAAGYAEHPYNDARCHKLIDVPDFLAKYLPKWKNGDETYHAVNSTHHQAVNNVAYGFETCAVASDGIIEAIYRGPFLGVQWHPEKLVETDERWMKLFKWFAEGLC